MKFKKTITGLLAVGLLTTSASAVFANISDNMKDDDLLDIIPISAPLDVDLSEEEVMEHLKMVGSVTGKVIEIRDFIPEEGSKFVSLADEEGQIVANVVVTEDTYILNDAEMVLGDRVTAYYDANKPMILIYPPQFRAEVLVVENEDENVKVDVFNDDLVSSDNMLKLNISDETKIVLEDGTDFEGKLTNRRLVVIYGVSTRSIPAQTVPDKIIVMFEKAEHPIYEFTEEEEKQFTEELKEMAKNADIMVEGKKIDGPPAYMKDDRTVMLPLRAIVEALGLDIEWDGDLEQIMIGQGRASLAIGKNYYTFAKMAPIELEHAPEIVEDRTFVPITFFREVIKMNNAYMFEGQIVIDNQEKME